MSIMGLEPATLQLKDGLANRSLNPETNDVLTNQSRRSCERSRAGCTHMSREGCGVMFDIHTRCHHEERRAGD